MELRHLFQVISTQAYIMYYFSFIINYLCYINIKPFFCRVACFAKAENFENPFYNPFLQISILEKIHIHLVYFLSLYFEKIFKMSSAEILCKNILKKICKYLAHFLSLHFQKTLRMILLQNNFEENL